MQNSKKRRYSDETRQMVIQDYLHGKKCIEISRIFGKPQQTIYSIILVYVNEDRVDQKPVELWEMPRLTMKFVISSKTKFRKKPILPWNYESRKFSNILKWASIDSCLSDFHYTFKRLHVVTAR